VQVKNEKRQISVGPGKGGAIQPGLSRGSPHTNATDHDIGFNGEKDISGAVLDWERGGSGLRLQNNAGVTYCTRLKRDSQEG